MITIMIQIVALLGVRSVTTNVETVRVLLPPVVPVRMPQEKELLVFAKLLSLTQVQTQFVKLAYTLV